MNNNAEIYLIAGVIGTIGSAILADIWPGFIANLIFYRLTFLFPLGSFLFAMHVSRQDYTKKEVPEEKVIPKEAPKTVNVKA